MPVFRIPEPHLFPDPNLADPSGLLGVGGDLHPDRLGLAYKMGIFPWYSDDQPILWWSPDPRMVLFVEDFHVPRSLGKIVRRQDFEVTMDQAFGQVIRACARTPRPGQRGTWITEEMAEAYESLFESGLAHSVESWQDGQLVGGLYGVTVGRMFCGESMFARVSNSSKVAFVHLVRQLERWGLDVVDCQVYTDHLARFGAREVPRSEYLELLAARRDDPARPGPWAFDEDFECRG